VPKSPCRLHAGQVTGKIGSRVPGFIPPVPGGPCKADADELVEELPSPVAGRLNVTRLTPAITRIEKPAGLLDHAEQAVAGLTARSPAGPLQGCHDITHAEGDHGGQSVLDTDRRLIVKAIAAVAGSEAGDQCFRHLAGHRRVREGQRANRVRGADPAEISSRIVLSLAAGSRRHHQGGPARGRWEHVPQYRDHHLRRGVSGGAKPAWILGSAAGGPPERQPVLRLSGQDDQ
jgi:hypothetical protein